MKKITCILMVLMSVLLTFTVQAAEVDKQEGEIAPSYVGLGNMSSDLSITSIGEANCSITGKVRSGYTGTVNWELQCKNGTVWNPQKMWTSSVKSTFSQRKTTYVTSKHTFRIKAVINVFDLAGKKVESVTVYSNTVTF